MSTILVLYVCTNLGCNYHVQGEFNSLTGCLVQSQIAAANWKMHNTGTITRILCVSPERLQTLLNRGKA
jgi:enhancing lycopene biosynthesis protein 2